jgi:hypothetical protein
VTAGRPARRRTHGRGRRALITAATLTLLVGSASLSGTVAADDEFDNRCTPTGPGSADSIERQALSCQAALDELYVDCMRTVPGTPDSAERWVDYCKSQSVG